MKKYTRKLALGMAAVLLAGSLSACSANTGDGIAKYGDEIISTEEAEFWLRYQQWTTEAYYWDMYEMYMGVDNMWETSYTETQTMGEYLHENTMAQILQTRILLDHMSDYGIEELTEDQKTAAQEAIDSFLEAYPAFEQYVSASTEDMYSYMEMNAKAILVIQAVKDAAGVTVEEEEYAKYGIQYVEVSASEVEDAEDLDELADTEDAEETEAAEETAAEAEDTLEGEELANTILAEVQAGGDLETVAAAYELTAYDSSYLLTGETSEDVRYTASVDLGVGEAALTESDSGWYIVVRTNDYDEEASESAMETLIDERETEAFEATYAEWAESAAAFTVNEDKWEDIAITGKIYETPEDETEEAVSEDTEDEGAETEAVEETENVETEATEETETAE